MSDGLVFSITFLFLLNILLTMTVFSMLMPVFGQTPTTVTPNTGNLKFQEQDAFIVIPPEELPPQYQQQLLQSQAQQSSISNDDVLKFLAGMAGGSLTGLWARFKSITEKKQIIQKTENIEEVQREQSTQIIKGAEVDDKLADQVYENMGKDEAAKITDKPAIKKTNLEANKIEAAQTAAKIGK
jgi:hypothetical protein